MNIDFLTTKQQYKKVLLDIKDLVESEIENGRVRITIGDHYQPNNTPLYIVLEFHVVGRELEDDYGLCLSVSYQHYDPTLNKLAVFVDKLFVSSDLTRANGEGVSYFGLIKLDVGEENFQLEAEETRDKVISYLRAQAPRIVEVLKSGY